MKIRSVLVLYGVEVTANIKFIDYDCILVFDLALKLALIKRGHRNVCLISELTCEHKVSKSIFDAVKFDISNCLKLNDESWASVIDEISISDLFEFQLRNSIGSQINFYVTLNKFLSENRYDFVRTNIESGSPYNFILKEICNGLNVNFSTIPGVKLTRMDGSHLDFSTTQGVGSSHRSGSIGVLVGAVINRTFLHSGLRFLQRVYITNAFLRALFFCLLFVSNAVKDIFETRKRSAVVVCYDKWISKLLDDASSDTVIVFHTITPPISRHFMKYYLSPRYRFTYSFASIFSENKNLVERSTTCSGFHSLAAIDIIQKKISEEGRFLVDSFLAIKSATKRYSVKALLTSYDSPMLHRAAVVAAKTCGVPTILNLHGLVSPPEFNGEALYCDYIVSWSNLLQLYDERDNRAVIKYENPYHSCNAKLRNLENKDCYSVVIATSNSPTDYCTCLMNVAENKFLEMVTKLSSNSTLRKWSFTFKIHPSENINIYQKILSDLDVHSIKLVRELENDQYSEFDFAICLSPTTFMFDLVSKGIPTFFCDFEMHEVSYYEKYLFSAFNIKSSVFADVENFLISKAFLSDKIKLEQEQLRNLVKGTGPKLLIDNIVEKIMKDRLCKD